MLHVLWLLAKIILIIVGCILGLILLILLLILFCPVRYRGTLSKETNSFRELTAGGKVSWLFGLIALKCRFWNGQFTKEIYVLGIPLLRLLKFLRSRNSQPLLDSSPASSKSFSDLTETEDEIPIHHIKQPEIFSSESDSDTENDESEEFYQEIKETGENFFFRLGNRLRAFWEKIKKIYYKIRGIPLTVQKFSSTVQSTCTKIDWWKKFLGHPRTKAALSQARASAFRLLKHVFPTRATGHITFGSSDPSITGTVLAVLGMTIPLHQNCIQVTPVFENQNFIQGNINLKGRVYGIVFLQTAIRLYFNKNIKYVIHRWKHREG